MDRTPLDRTAPDRAAPDRAASGAAFIGAAAVAALFGVLASAVAQLVASPGVAVAAASAATGLAVARRARRHGSVRWSALAGWVAGGVAVDNVVGALRGAAFDPMFDPMALAPAWAVLPGLLVQLGAAVVRPETPATSVPVVHRALVTFGVAHLAVQLTAAVLVSAGFPSDPWGPAAVALAGAGAAAIATASGPLEPVRQRWLAVATGALLALVLVPSGAFAAPSDRPRAVVVCVVASVVAAIGVDARRRRPA